MLDEKVVLEEKMVSDEKLVLDEKVVLSATVYLSVLGNRQSLKRTSVAQYPSILSDNSNQYTTGSHKLPAGGGNTQPR